MVFSYGRTVFAREDAICEIAGKICTAVREDAAAGIGALSKSAETGLRYRAGHKSGLRLVC